MADSKPTNVEQSGVEKKYFQNVLDDVVSLNSLFTVAVFIGLSFAQPGQVQSLADDPRCHPDTKIRKRLVAFEIASFSCFVFAGVLAKTVKVFLYSSEKKKQDARKAGEKNNQAHYPSIEKEIQIRAWTSVVGFYLSIYGTMTGCLLLLVAMVDIVQIKLGRLSCYSGFTIGTVSVMVCTIGLSLLTYFTTVTYDLAVAYTNLKKGHEEAHGAEKV